MPLNVLRMPEANFKNLAEIPKSLRIEQSFSHTVNVTLIVVIDILRKSRGWGEYHPSNPKGQLR